MPKAARIGGKAHVNTAGKVVEVKSAQECSCQHGRQKIFRCTEFSEEDRQQLLAEYYVSGDYNRQRDFILNHTVLTNAVSKDTGRRKQRHIQCLLPLNGVRN